MLIYGPQGSDSSSPIQNKTRLAYSQQNTENCLKFCLPGKPLPAPSSSVLLWVSVCVFTSRTSGELIAPFPLCLLCFLAQATVWELPACSSPRQLPCQSLTPPCLAFKLWVSRGLGITFLPVSESRCHLPKGSGRLLFRYCHLPAGMSKAPLGFACGPGLESIRQFLDSVCSLLSFPSLLRFFLP